MHDLKLRSEARRLRRSGRTLAFIAAELKVAPATVQRWVTRSFPTDDRPPAPCVLCDGLALDSPTAASYAYLLGQYLGDGHLVTSARVPVLRIYACDDYPAIIDEIADAVLRVRGSKPAQMRKANSERLCKIQSYWKHWPCLLPQHGPGRKHERPIVLTGWQQAIVDEHPWPLIRGLIHSDGCRSINRVTVHGVRYEYPRYFFANESADILAIMGAALDRVGVAWRFNRPNSLSIAKRAAVAVLDEHVGPKR